MRPSCLLSVLLVVAVSLEGASAANATASGPRPTVGDRWTYRTNSTLGAGLSLGGQATLTVTSVGPATVEGVTFNAVRMAVHGAGTAAGNFSSRFVSGPASGTWVLSGEEVTELDGLKVVSTVLDLEANGTLQVPPVPIAFRLSVQNTSTHRFVSDSWRFPLAVGNTTVVRSELNFTEDVGFFYGLPSPPVRTAGRVPWNVSYSLEATVVIDTPAGRFDTYRIRQTFPDASSGVLFFAPAAGNYARTESHNGTSEVARTELVSYRYQALEPSRFMGLTTDQWLVAGVLVAAASGGFVWWFSRRRRASPPERGPPPPAT